MLPWQHLWVSYTQTDICIMGMRKASVNFQLKRHFCSSFKWSTCNMSIEYLKQCESYYQTFSCFGFFCNFFFLSNALDSYKNVVDIGVLTLRKVFFLKNDWSFPRYYRIAIGVRNCRTVAWWGRYRCIYNQSTVFALFLSFIFCTKEFRQRVPWDSHSSPPETHYHRTAECTKGPNSSTALH